MAGVVEAVGPNATKFAVGDRVGALLAGGTVLQQSRADTSTSPLAQYIYI